MPHTPGMWSRNIPPATRYPVVFAGRNRHVAQVCTSGLSADEVEHNCSLIAAAPDLLEAAKHAITEWRLHGQLTDSCRGLERAVEKAEAVRPSPAARKETT